MGGVTVTYPVPVDSTYDYTTISPQNIQVGTLLFSFLEAEGDVFSIVSGTPTWTYFLNVLQPDSTTTVIAASLFDDPSTEALQWWLRFRMLIRQAKPSKGAVTTAGDGSKWIYPDDGTGTLTCYVSGTTFTRGANKYLGELTLNPYDIYKGQDPDYDWIPVYDATTVSVGDRVRYGYANGATVDDIVITTNDYYTRTEFMNSGNSYGWVDVLADGAVPGDAQWTFMEQVLYPDADSLFSAPDGSRWIFIPPPDFVTPGYYYCWGRGSVYAPGALFRREEIAGGLTPIV